jgi:predicted MFS family arabinose efflux permease
VWSVFHENFWLFCAGTAGVGAFQAFAQYYRLAAADSVGPDLKARAISNVLVGGWLLLLLGPVLASWSTDLFAVRFAGSYMMVSILSAISALLILTAYRDTEDNVPQRRDFPTPVRPLKKIMLQPVSLAAIANNVIGGAMMMLVMTATPLAAVTCGHDISEGANIIQWHMVGMYVPSLFAGKLIGYLGLPTIIFTGIGLSMACGLIASASPDSFYLALLCLGVGWNFMFVGGTTLLAQSYRPEEKDRDTGCGGTTALLCYRLSSFGCRFHVREFWLDLSQYVYSTNGHDRGTAYASLDALQQARLNPLNLIMN